MSVVKVLNQRFPSVITAMIMDYSHGNTKEQKALTHQEMQDAHEKCKNCKGPFLSEHTNPKCERIHTNFIRSHVNMLEITNKWKRRLLAAHMHVGDPFRRIDWVIRREWNQLWACIQLLHKEKWIVALRTTDRTVSPFERGPLAVYKEGTTAEDIQNALRRDRLAYPKGDAPKNCVIVQTVGGLQYQAHKIRKSKSLTFLYKEWI